jgi:hypothetical protein
MLNHRDDDEQLHEFAQDGAELDAQDIAAAPFYGVTRGSREMREKISGLEEHGLSLYYDKLHAEMQDPEFVDGVQKRIVQGKGGQLRFQDPELTPLGLVFNSFLDQHVAISGKDLQSKWIALQRNGTEIAKRQRAIEAQAKAVTAAQATADKRNKDQLEAIRRERLKIGNERFERWINNFKWTLHVFYHESYFVTWLILGTFLISSIPYYLTARFSISDRCLHQRWCRAIAIRLWKE